MIKLTIQMIVRFQRCFFLQSSSTSSKPTHGRYYIKSLGRRMDSAPNSPKPALDTYCTLSQGLSDLMANGRFWYCVTIITIQMERRSHDEDSRNSSHDWAWFDCALLNHHMPWFIPRRQLESLWNRWSFWFCWQNSGQIKCIITKMKIQNSGSWQVQKNPKPCICSYRKPL